MKYKYGFVKEVNKEYLWYKEEIKELFIKYDMQDLWYKIDSVDMYRWWPNEIFKVLEKDENCATVVDHTTNRIYVPINEFE